MRVTSAMCTYARSCYHVVLNFGFDVVRMKKTPQRTGSRRKLSTLMLNIPSPAGATKTPQAIPKALEPHNSDLKQVCPAASISFTRVLPVLGTNKHKPSNRRHDFWVALQVMFVKMRRDALADDMARESASREPTNSMLEGMSNVSSFISSSFCDEPCEYFFGSSFVSVHNRCSRRSTGSKRTRQTRRWSVGTRAWGSSSLSTTFR